MEHMVVKKVIFKVQRVYITKQEVQITEKNQVMEMEYTTTGQ